MTNVSYAGSGIAAVDPTLIGQGQGLQVGKTAIDFKKGTVSLVTGGGSTNIGNFSGLNAYGSKSTAIQSLVFKSKVACSILIDQLTFTYETVNEWVTFNNVNVAQIYVVRTASGQTPDVFDFNVQASDNPAYTFAIQKSSPESELEVEFPTLQRAIGTYVQNSDLRGAKKIQVFLNTANLSETGKVTITAEIFDPASQQWKNLIPAAEFFSEIVANQFLQTQFGDTISRPVTPTNTYVAFELANGAIQIVQAGSTPSIPLSSNPIIAGLTPPIGYVLPSGASVFRFKAVVDTGALTFSLGIIKVFD